MLFRSIADINPGEKAEVSKVELKNVKPLLRKRAESVDEAVEWLVDNKNSLVELTLVTDEFLTAADRKRLNSVHSGIVTIVPEVRNPEIITGSTTFNIDINKGMNELFRDYFKYSKGQEPNDEIMDLFNEILAEEVEK